MDVSLLARRRLPVSLAVAALLIVGLPSRQAHPQCETVKLIASDAGEVDEFGHSVCVDGTRIIVGTQRDDDGGQDAGAAYIFQWDGATWAEEAKLTASDASGGDLFGVSVAISGNLAIVGARLDDDNGSNSGSAYVFRNDGVAWIEEAKLTASNAGASHQFGYSVSIDGDVAAVGATNAGNAYIFRFDGQDWIQEDRLFSPGALDFGRSVAIRGPVALIGAPITNNAVGSAYIFRYNGKDWPEEAQLSPSDGVPSGQFGTSVSVTDNVAVIGAPSPNNPQDNDGGSVYVFRWNGVSWAEEVQLTAFEQAAQDLFGYSVSIGEDDLLDVVAVGAPRDGGGNLGAAYVFRYNGQNWTGEARLIASDGEQWDEVGRAVATNGQVIVTGAQHDYHDTGIRGGSVYVFPSIMLDDDCNSNGVADSCDIAVGFSDDCNGNGVPDECENPPCLADITGPLGVPDGCVDAFDLGAMLAAWCSAVNDPNPPSPPCENCTPANLAVADITGAANVPDGCVDAFDLAKLLAEWCSVAGGNPCGTCGP